MGHEVDMLPTFYIRVEIILKYFILLFYSLLIKELFNLLFIDKKM